jgi:hypothetical protein
MQSGQYLLRKIVK